MKKEGKNLDDLLKGKLSGEAYPFKEAYWQSAQQVIKANGVKAASGFALSKLTIALSIAAASVASFGLGWFIFSPETTSNQNEKVATIIKQNPQGNNQVLTEEQSKANKGNEAEKIATAKIVATDPQLPDNKLDLIAKQAQTMTIESEENSENKEVYEAQSTNSKEISSEYPNQNLSAKAEYSISKTQVEEVLENEGNSAIIKKVFQDENIENTLVFEEPLIDLKAGIAENRPVFEKLEFLTLAPYEVASKFNATNQEKKFKKSNYYELSFGIQTFASLNNKVNEWNMGAVVILRKQLGRNFLIGSGIQVEQTKARHSYIRKVIDQIETEYENSFLQDDYIEKTRLVPGIVYNQGVPMQGMVEETYFDTVSTQVTETLTRTGLDTNEVSTLDNYKANYLDIPLELGYSISFGKLDVRLGVTPSIGFLAGYRKSLSSDKQELAIPNQRFMVAGSTQLGYYLSTKLNLNVGFGYRKNFNALVGGNNQFGGNIGLRYTF